MKIIVAFLIALLGLLQYTLWFSPGGWFSQYHLHQAIEKQSIVNTHLQNENSRLLTDINALKIGRDAIEARARSDLGMVKKDEIFYRIAKNIGNSNLETHQ